MPTYEGGVRNPAIPIRPPGVPGLSAPRIPGGIGGAAPETVGGMVPSLPPELNLGYEGGGPITPPIYGGGGVGGMDEGGSAANPYGQGRRINTAARPGGIGGDPRDMLAKAAQRRLTGS